VVGFSDYLNVHICSLQTDPQHNNAVTHVLSGRLTMGKTNIVLVQI
jgi:hypothetical protein